MTSTELTFEDVVERLRRNDRTLTQLNMLYVTFPDGWNEDSVSLLMVFVDALEKNTVLTKLSYNALEFEPEDAATIAGALEKNTTLKELDLGLNDIGKKGAVAIAGALKENTTLKELDLGYNKIGDAGAKALADVLETNSSITKLGLGLSNIGNEGARALADALKKNNTLTELYLGMIIDICDPGHGNANSIRDEGARAFADALEKNTNLTILDMSVNEIGNEGARALADVLEKNATLTSLVLNRNKIGDEGARALANVLRKNSTLVELSLWGNKIGYEGISALDEAILYNTTILNLYLDSIDEKDTSTSHSTQYNLGRIEGTLRRNRVQGIDRAKLRAEIIAEEEEKKRKAEEEAVPIIAPTECKIMVSFNDSSAGSDAEKLANYLTRNGHPTFCTRLYCRDMTGDWRKVTTKGVMSCKYYIMLMTKGWQVSNECQDETETAINRKVEKEVTLIPVWYEDFDYNFDKEGDAYRVRFRHIQSVRRQRSTWMEDILNQLGGGRNEIEEKSENTERVASLR